MSEGALPASWAWARPDELAKNEPHSLAIGPFGSSLLTSDYRPQGYPLVFVRNIRSGVFDGPTTKFIDKEKAYQLLPHWVRPGDVLVTKMGDPPGDTCLYPLSCPPGVITSDCIKVAVDPFVGNPRFFVYAVRTPGVRRQVLGMTKGVAQKKVSLERFRETRLPLAPRKEQDRVVDALESYFTRLDDAEATLERVRRNLERYRASVLQAIVEGPWPWVSLGSLVLQMQNGLSRRSGGAGSPTAVLRLADVRDGQLVVDEPRRIPLSPDEKAKYLLRPGDLVFTRVNGSRRLCGSCFSFQTETEWAYCDHFIRTQVDQSKARSKFLSAVLTLGPSRLAIERGMVTTAGQNTVSQPTLEATPVPLPPLAEQDRAVAEISRCESIVNASASSLEAALARVIRLRQCVLKVAFEGRIVDQDPTDEPASVLLDRIRAGRAMAASSPESPRRRGRPRKAVKK